MTRFRFSPEQAADMCREYLAGKSLHQLARRYDCHYTTIWDYLERAGVKRRPRGGPNFKGKKYQP